MQYGEMACKTILYFIHLQTNVDVQRNLTNVSVVFLKKPSKLFGSIKFTNKKTRKNERQKMNQIKLTELQK